MVDKSLKYVLAKAKEIKNVIIVGAGNAGVELLAYLAEEDAISILAIFDNNSSLTGKRIKDVEIVKPYRVEQGNCLYIIAVGNVKFRRECYMQLKELGIEEESIAVYHYQRDYDYLCSLDERCYAEEIQELYYERLGKRMNWEKPVTYNEKINWEKLNVTDKRRTMLSDKYLVREWVAEKIGDKYLTKLYGVWDCVEDIDFDELPEQFVLKLNNGSGRNIIVKDKSKINWEEICSQINEWKKYNFAFFNLELQYKDIIPQIICEEYLVGLAETVYDYNIYCFHGKPHYIWCIKGSHRPGCMASFYNRDWEMQPFSYGYPKDPVLAPKPEKLEEMLNVSRILSHDFEHVRVDLYNLPDGRVLFGEMTFSTWGGLERWIPEDTDFLFGKLI